MKKIIKQLEQIKKEFDAEMVQHIIDRYDMNKEDASDMFEQYEASNNEEATAFDAGYANGIQFVINLLQSNIIFL